jgi:hypothetical protein
MSAGSDRIKNTAKAAVGYTVGVATIIVLSPAILYYYCRPRFLSDKTLFKTYQEYKQYGGYTGTVLDDIKHMCCDHYIKKNMHRIERYFVLL